MCITGYKRSIMFIYIYISIQKSHIHRKEHAGMDTVNLWQFNIANHGR